MIQKSKAIKLALAFALLTSVLTAVGVVAFLYYTAPLGKAFAVLRLANANFYKEVDKNALAEGASSGMIEALGDPYSVYMDPSEWQNFLVKTSGEYSGIGVTMDSVENKLRIALPMKGSPAEAAGLKADDIILGVDGSPVTTTDDAAASIRGPKGTQVVLTIKRGDDIFDVAIIRDDISIPAVTYSVIDDGVGYLQLTSFNEHSFSETASALENLREQGIKALLLDLRYNGGGYLNQCLDISELFVEEGLVVSLRYKKEPTESFLSSGQGLGMPLVVLVNEGTASASEILAGAIKDRGAGVLVGKKTFGKGLVQGSYPLWDGSVVKLTTAEYLTPNGTAINKQGLTPDYLVEGDEEQLERARSLALDLILQTEEKGVSTFGVS